MARQLANSVVNRKWVVVRSVFRFSPKNSVDFGRFTPKQKRNRNRTFLGRFLGRFLVKTNQIVGILEGSVCMCWHNVTWSYGVKWPSCSTCVCCATRYRPTYAIILVRQTCIYTAANNSYRYSSCYNTKHLLLPGSRIVRGYLAGLS